MEQEFKVSTGSKILYGFFAAALLAAGVFVLLAASTSEHAGELFIMPVLMFAGSVLIVITQWKRRS